MEINKEKHINLLLAENKKNSKKKRVSFSIFQAETFEEIEQLRKMKENALNHFQQQKTKTNEYRDMISRNLRINTSESKSNDSLSAERNNSIDSENKVNSRKGSKSSMDNIKPKEEPNNIKVIQKKKDNNEATIPNIKQIEKERLRKEEQGKEREKPSEINKKQEQEREMEQQRINEEKLKQDIEDKLRKEIEDKLREENEERIKKEIEDKINRENEERMKKEKEELLRMQKEEQLKREEEERIKRENEERIKKENEERIKKENEAQIEKEKLEKLEREKQEQIKKEVEIKIKRNKDIMRFITSLSSIILSKKQKNTNYTIFKSNCLQYITKKEDDYINYELTNPDYNEYINKKTHLFSLNTSFLSFLSNIRNNIHQTHQISNQLLKANKYIQYRQYKTKALIFESLYSFSKKQRNWINSIRNELSKGLLWSCLDSLKIFTNYKKIKAYLSLQKKKKILYCLRKNVRSKYELERKSHTSFLIFIYKNFLSTVRKDILIKKGRECDEYIASEYRKQMLLKKVFNLIHVYYSIKKEKMKKTKKLFQVKHQNSEYINIKISKKETIKYSNKNMVTKQTTNRINIV